MGRGIRDLSCEKFSTDGIGACVLGENSPIPKPSVRKQLILETHLKSERPITRRWIWLVPSKICSTLASRMYRSTG